MADGTKITPDIDSIAKFGMAMLDVMKQHIEGTAKAESKIGAAALGLTGTSEGQTLADWSNQIAQARAQMDKDLPNGLEAHSYVSIIVVANYRAGDRSQAKAVDSMWDLFLPDRGTPSIASVEAKAEAKAKAAAADKSAGELARQREAYFYPGSQAAKDQAKAEAAERVAALEREREVYFNSGPSKPHEPSPHEQVRLFDKKYGKDIHSPPPDPNAPDPGPVPGL